jgi:hypothetical protein
MYKAEVGAQVLFIIRDSAFDIRYFVVIYCLLPAASCASSINLPLTSHITGFTLYR